MRHDVWAVLISDVHFHINTLPLASFALSEALLTAEQLNVPLIIAGDLNDTKSILQAKCVNAILGILREKKQDTRVIVLVGNHDLLNEKGEDHSLHFLDDLCDVVRHPIYHGGLGLWLIPYQTDVERIRFCLAGEVLPGSTVIMHQGVMGAHMGEYVVDKTSLPPETFADYRVISGHYHRAQDIKCGRPRKGAVGLFSYIGTPYSVTFAEAHDGPKGFQLLLKNGLLEQVPLDLRKHVIEEVDLEGLDIFLNTATFPRPEDLFWLKVHGPASELDKLNKKELGMRIQGHENFKLDKIYTDAEKQSIVEIESMPQDRILDQLIDDSEETVERKAFLKTLWREILT